MPANRLSSSPVEVSRYDILTCDDPDTGLPVHAMLCDADAESASMVLGADIAVVEMCPPLNRRQAHPTAVGSAGLTAGQRSRLKTFAARETKASEAAIELRKRLEITQYTIHPSSRPPSKTLSIWRYNCVGFVLRAYQNSGVRPLKRSGSVTKFGRNSGLPSTAAIDQGLSSKMAGDRTGHRNRSRRYRVLAYRSCRLPFACAGPPGRIDSGKSRRFLPTQGRRRVFSTSIG